MSLNKQHILQGKSRKAYFFSVYTPDHDFPSTPCIYIYTNLTKNELGHDYFDDVYCGETDNTQERINCHSSKQDIISKYTHICICPVSWDYPKLCVNGKRTGFEFYT